MDGKKAHSPHLTPCYHALFFVKMELIDIWVHEYKTLWILRQMRFLNWQETSETKSKSSSRQNFQALLHNTLMAMNSLALFRWIVCTWCVCMGIMV